MSQTTAQTSYASGFRRLALRIWEDPESRSTTVGLAGVIIFYLLMWLLGPYLFHLDSVPTAARPHASPREFSIELAPETFAKPAPKPSQPFKFVETNPDAPENVPDKTNNFAAQNQQVAQEKPTPDGKSDRPALEGKKDFDSTQIVTGQLAKPVEQVEAVPETPTPPREATVAKAKAEQNPLAGFEKKAGEDKLSYGSNVAKLADNSRPIPDKVEGEKNVPLIEGATANQPAIDPQRPRPRQQLVTQQQTRPAILAENKFGTTNIGNIAVDAKWSNYGAYLQRMINVVQVQWERILLSTVAYPTSGSTVTVKFIMDAEGKIARIVNLESTASESASRACVSAISDRAPYGPWTDDMKAMLGESQEMTFTFYYQ